MGAGFTITLSVLACVRELLGTGTIAGKAVMPEAFVPWAALGLPVGAFVTLGLMLGLVNLITKKRA